MNESTAVVLDFEKDILEIEEKIEHLKLLAKTRIWILPGKSGVWSVN